MVFYLILCRSLTYAQRTAQVLERSGMNCQIIRTPRDIAVEGCGYSVRIPNMALDKALRLLRQEGLAPKQVFGKYERNGYSEVKI